MSTTWAWRIPSLLQGALPLLQCLTIYTLPESPRWLVAQGRHTDARRILTTYHAGGDASSPLVAFEMAEIEGALTHEADTSAHSWLDLVRTPANRRRTLIAAVVGWFAQWNGAGVISYYLFLVLNGIGITAAREQTLINALLQVTNWLAAIFIGALMVDRLGRRTLFLVSTGGMLLSYSVWTGLSVSFNETRDAVTGRVVVAFVFVTYFFYAIAWAPLLQAYTVEIYPYTLRGRGLSAMYVFSFVGLVVANQVNAIAMEAIGWRYYLVFVCILAMLMVVIWFLFPETKGHTLEEIREVFEGRAEGKLADVAEARVDEKRKRDVEQVEVA